jgi:sugar-specific transcriptional regulator TrmB
MPALQETLTAAGLQPLAAQIYLILIENGELTPKAIATHTSLSRASIYEGITELLTKDYIEYRKEGRNAYYKPAHPQILESLVEQKKREAALLEGEMKETIRALTGSYNLTMKKPGIRMFEGMDGFAEALDDTLTAKDTIYTFVDVDSVETFAHDVNAAYVKKRQALGKEKKILMFNTPSSRAYMENIGSAATTTRLLPEGMLPFHTGMQIYDNKISYFTLRKDNIISMIIEDQDIAQFHRSMFEHYWNQAERNSNTSSGSSSSVLAADGAATDLSNTNTLESESPSA